MTRFCCCICGNTSLVKTNFKFDQQHNAYCVKNDHAKEVIKYNPTLENENDQETIVSFAMARSDAEFDGYEWKILKKAEQSRYMLRSKLALQAAQKAYDLINKFEIE